MDRGPNLGPLPQPLALLCALMVPTSLLCPPALSEANTLNNRQPVVWGQLALLCVRAGRLPEAEQAIEHAYKLDLAESPLLTALASALHAAGKWGACERAARRAISVAAATGADPTGAQRALGDALYELGQYEGSLAAFRAALDAGAADAVAEHCRAQAGMLLSAHLGRPDEAAAL